MDEVMLVEEISMALSEYNQLCFNLNSQIHFEASMPAGCFDTWTWEHEEHPSEARDFIHRIVAAYENVVEKLDAWPWRTTRVLKYAPGEPVPFEYEGNGQE